MDIKSDMAKNSPDAAGVVCKKRGCNDTKSNDELHG